MHARPIRRRDEDRGASAVEYGLMLAAIAAVVVGVTFGMGQMVKQAFEHTCSAIADPMSESLVEPMRGSACAPRPAVGPSTNPDATVPSDPGALDSATATDVPAPPASDQTAP